MKVIQTRVRSISTYALLQYDSLEQDSVVTYDIFIKRDNDYMIIIEAGTLLSQKLFKKLKKQDNLYISKHDEKQTTLSCDNLHSYIQHNKNNLQKTLQYLYTLNTKLFVNYLNHENNQIDLECVTSIVKSIIFLVKDNESYLKKTITHFSNDYELAFHSLHVAIYVINLGYFLSLNDDELLKLGTAGLLHDLGIKKIDNAITQKNAELNLSELTIVQQHAKYSVEIIKQNHIYDPYIIDAITHHHERNDGHGYPDKLNERQINPFASILAISDVFDALTNNRPYRDKHSSFEALKLMMKDTQMINQFNQKYLKVFLQSLLK